jgi:4-aminobutyrate aminotransferase/(S)-3-amino-2-methylpropionate transaminase
MNARGLGTFQAFDGSSSEVRDKIVLKMRNLGVQCGASGDLALRLRPALIFKQKHAEILLDRLDRALKSF